MKKLLILFAFAFIVQAAIGQSALPNGNFESWTFFEKYGYWEPNGGFFRTLNALDTVPLPAGISTYPITDPDSVHGGNKAARVITRNISALQVLIPGVIGTIKIDWLNERALLGEPYTWTNKADRFQGYYMSYPLNGDSTAAICLLSKWNNSKGQRDTIAYAKVVFYGEVTQYQEFNEELVYRDLTTMPDSITLLMLSCGGFDASNMFGSIGQIGTQAYYDDVTLTDIAGLEYILMPEVDVRLAPNPATDRMLVTLDKEVKNSLLEVYSAQGQLINTFRLDGKTTTLDVSRLKNGTYYYKVTDGSNGLNSGSFIVTK